MEGFVPLIKPSEIFFNCLEINDSTLSYQQLLFGESPDKNDDLMFFSKVKSLMRKLLISVDKVNTIYTLTGRENVHISEILEIYQEKTHIYDCTQLKIKVPIQTTAKFLENCIGFLDISYKANNWKSIYEGVLSDFEERAIKFKDLSLETKTFLATGLENIEKMKSSMQNAIERVSKFELVKFLNEKFIKGLKFPICLTSKNMRISVLESFRKKIDKKKALALEEAFYNGDLMLLNQDECIHKKMDEAGAHVFLFEGCS